MKNSAIYPVITLYQPWATWIMRGWKTIETRTHNRFECLLNQRVLIHAGKITDDSYYAVKNPYLTKEQLLYAPDEMVNGAILGMANVIEFGKLGDTHSKSALIDSGITERFGLFLADVHKFHEPIPCKGSMGIWYYDLENKVKVKKPV